MSKNWTAYQTLNFLARQRNAFWKTAGSESFDTLARFDRGILKLGEIQALQVQFSDRLIELGTQIETTCKVEPMGTSELQQQRRAKLNQEMIKLYEEIDLKLDALSDS